MKLEHDANRYTVLFDADDFARLDETDDREFYARERIVQHLDAEALAAVEHLVGELIVEDAPVILDLMASWDSHIPETLEPAQVVGLGLNEKELKQNPVLSEYVVHDLNKDPVLPFPNDTFDAVLNTVSVDYMTRPLAVFADVRRILKPGGLFLVIFSNRFFPPKVVDIWRRSSEEERLLLVEDFFRQTADFEAPKVFVSKGKPRPKDDKYAHLGIPSDPIYAVYAEKTGGSQQRAPRPTIKIDFGEPLDREELADKMQAVKHTFRCPYCDERLRKWAVPQTPFTEWDNEFMYICFNDACPYLVHGWQKMAEQGNRGISYRLMYNPDRDAFMPVPVPSLNALKESIVD